MNKTQMEKKAQLQSSSEVDQATNTEKRRKPKLESVQQVSTRLHTSMALNQTTSLQSTKNKFAMEPTALADQRAATLAYLEFLKCKCKSSSLLTFPFQNSNPRTTPRSQSTRWTSPCMASTM